MNYMDYGHRVAYFGEITLDGTVTADNVMEKLKEYHSDTSAEAELQGEPIHDFGAMAPGDKGVHEFVVKNVGTDDLMLELGATTCKCTLGDLKNNRLAPGESTSVQLEWTVKTDRTDFMQSAELRTNDPLKPAIQLIVQGLVIREIEFVPKQIPFGEVLSTQPFEFSTKMYSYYDNEIELIKGMFGSEELMKFAEVSFEPFELSEEDGSYKNARQAFLITAKVKPGLRQGPLVTTMDVSFRKKDNLIGSVAAETDAEGAAEGDAKTESDDSQDVESQATEAETTAAEPQDPAAKEMIYIARAECAGRVIGALTMIETSDLKSTEGGGYIWTLGRLDREANLEYRALVALKGSERDTTNLTIGETYPSDVIEAEFGKPLEGNMRLFPLKLKLKPSDKAIDLLGKNKDDFGWIWIESDNPNVSRMKVAVKLFIEPRP